MTSKPIPPKSPGRPGLQRKEVADAIDVLVERGIRDPSLGQLRQHLGRGSNSTISRLRNEIRGERLLTTRAPVEGSVESSVLPALVSAMERLGEEAAKAADDQIDAMRSDFEAAQSTMMRERDEALAAAHDIRIELAARADQVKDLRDTIKALRAEINDEKKRLERAESARHQSDERVHAVSLELKGVSDTRDQLEKALSDREAALEQAGAARADLQTKHAALSTARTELEAVVARQAEDAAQNQVLIEELSQAQAVIEKRAVEVEQGKAAAEISAAATIDGLNARLIDQQGVIDSLIDKIGQ